MFCGFMRAAPQQDLINQSSATSAPHMLLSDQHPTCCRLQPLLVHMSQITAHITPHNITYIEPRYLHLDLRRLDASHRISSLLLAKTTPHISAYMHATCYNVCRPRHARVAYTNTAASQLPNSTYLASEHCTHLPQVLWPVAMVSIGVLPAGPLGLLAVRAEPHSTAAGMV